MRFKKLALERYGHFTDFELDFSGGPDLHIIVGPNEAGKSTILHGLRDALFGIDTRSPFNFLHDYKEMRLMAEIEDGDGNDLAFRRRKGARNTLLSLDEASLDDKLLSAFLGPIDKDFFERMFGLDHAGLRRGGEALLSTGGDAAESLFGAASGLASVLEISSRFGERANDLFSARKVATKPFYQALDARKTALAALRETTVTAAEWRKLEKEIKELGVERSGLDDASREHQQTLARANRVRRVRPPLTRIRELEARISELGDVPRIAAASFELRETAGHDLTSARSARGRLEDQLSGLEQQIGELDIPETTLALEDDIKALADSRGRVRAARQDLPKREAAVASRTTEMTRLIADLGASVAVEQAAELLPARGTLAQVRELITRDAGQQADLASSSEELRRAEAAHEEVTRELAGMPTVEEETDTTAVVGAIRQRGDLDAQRAEAAAASDEARRELETSVAALPMWSDDARALVSAKAPAAETVAAFEDRLTEGGARAEQLDEQIRSVSAELDAAAAELAELQTAGEVPTADVLARAREQRDQGWHLIRGRYVDEPAAVEDTEVASFSPDKPIADLFEDSVAHADGLADRKEAEAGRIAKDEELRRRIDLDTERRKQLHDELETVRAALAAASGEWSELWTPLGITPLSPREMSAWLGRRERIAEQLKTSERAEAVVARIDESIRTAREELCAALGRDDGAAASLSVLLEEAATRSERRRSETTKREQLTVTSADLERELGERRRKVETENARIEEWRTRWTSAMESLRQPADMLPSAAGTVLDVFEKLDEALRELGTEQDRLVKIRRDEEVFEKSVAELVGRATPEGAADGGNLLSAYEQLERDLQAALIATATRKKLTDQADGLRAALEKETDRLAAAESTLAELRKEAGVESDEQIVEVHDRARTRETLSAELENARGELNTAGDGLPFEELAAEADASSPDEVLSLISATETQVKETGTALDDIRARLTEREIQMREVRAGRGAEQHAEALERSIADMRDVCEEYVVQRASAYLLTRAIDRVRREKQGPILTSAREIFEGLTEKSFARVAVDFDEKDRPVLVGERPSGERVGVEGMSEGSRDQLFLALRLALVRRYVADAGALPFVADDLLVNFDDERAAAALEVLAELSETAQVVFFTHHAHLVEVAEGRLGAGVVRVHEMGGG